MKTRSTILILMLSLLLTVSGWAQNAVFTAQDCREMMPKLLAMAQGRAQMASQTYSMAQQVGHYAGMQSSQQQMQMHQSMYRGFSELASNPQCFDDPGLRQRFQAGVEEYLYRSETGDLRPYDQVKGLIAQHTARARWKASTPEGNAAHQAEIQQIEANTRQNTANHNARMGVINANAEVHNRAWNEQQRIGDVRQGQTVHGIYNEYQYVDPNTNQTYWVPMENTNPLIQNPDGSYTELQPYHNY